jgi:hypothetical protein
MREQFMPRPGSDQLYTSRVARLPFRATNRLFTALLDTGEVLRTAPIAATDDHILASILGSTRDCVRPLSSHVR